MVGRFFFLFFFLVLSDIFRIFAHKEIFDLLDSIFAACKLGAETPFAFMALITYVL